MHFATFSGFHIVLSPQEERLFGLEKISYSAACLFPSFSHRIEPAVKTMATTSIIILLLSIFVFRLASTAPLTPLESQLLAANGNKTLFNSEIAPAWATTSNVRSTSDLLWTCVLTLVICVFTVIHINVPQPNETAFLYLRRKVKWAIFAVLAPELVLFTALQQWRTARALKCELNSIYSKRSEAKPDTESITKFDMTYCFYAAMGGFVVDVSDIHDDLSLVALQPRGIVELADKGHFIEISAKIIKDKSKADVLAKLLVCVQVVWMVIQCIGRKAEGLPTSLLEIHVLVHVACALCMYALWIEVSMLFALYFGKSPCGLMFGRNLSTFKIQQLWTHQGSPMKLR